MHAETSTNIVRGAVAVHRFVLMTVVFTGHAPWIGQRCSWEAVAVRFEHVRLRVRIELLLHFRPLNVALRALDRARQAEGVKT